MREVGDGWVESSQAESDVHAKSDAHRDACAWVESDAFLNSSVREDEYSCSDSPGNTRNRT